MKKIRLPLVLLTLFSVSVQAEESDVWGLRLSVGTAPGISKDNTTNSTTAAGAQDPTNNGPSNLTGQYGIDVEAGARIKIKFESGLGLVVGPDLFFRSVKGTESVSGVSITETLNVFGIRAVVGPTFRLNEKIWFELTPFIEGGGATLKAEGSESGISLSQTSNIGTYLGYGITAGAFYSFTRHFELGIQAGYQGFSSQVKFSAGTVAENQTDTLTGNGFIGNVTAIWSF